MLNFAIEPSVLKPYVPRGTELDAWNGTTYVSLVAFSFFLVGYLINLFGRK